MDIYQPAEDSYLLQKYVKKLSFGRVLDIGTGSGIQILSVIKKEEVKESLAVDINETAVQELKEKSKLFKNLKVKQSDLFSNVTGKFETIIFNAPYLPQDYIEGKKIDDPALYGGKKGWETLERFFSELGNYLFQGGVVLVLFSSQTNKQKIDSFIEQNMFTYDLLEEQNVGMFETLYVYCVKGEGIREALQSRSIKNISYLTKGQRGLVFKAQWDKNAFEKKYLASEESVDVAIKIRSKESKAINRIENEIYWLRKVNKEGLGPKLHFFGKEYFVMEFIKGKDLPKFIEQQGKSSEKVKIVLKELLRQCFVLDKLKVSKEEFGRPLKNVVVMEDLSVILLDFERCHNDLEPKNVSQFCSYLIHRGYLDQEKGIELSQNYKKSYSQESFDLIVEELEKSFDEN